jgi:autotransporter-associated beta strand protein
MKPRPTLRLFLALSGSSLLAISSAYAVNANWTGGSSDALWSNTANWSASPVPGTGNTATFNAAAGAGGAVIDLGAGVTVNTISFVGPSFAAYTIGAGAVNSQSLILNGSGNAGLASSGTATTAQITINAAITVNNNQQWVLNQGANPWIINGNVTPNGASGSTIQVKINGHKADFNGLLADQVGGAKLQMSGANAQTATLTNPNNSFTGGLFFDNGSVSVNSIGNIGSNSAAGAGGELLFGSGFGGGTLVYTGSGNTTNRVVTVNHGFNGPTLNQSGASGNLNFTADLAFSAAASAVGSATLTLTGAAAGTGEFSGKLVDNGTTGFTPLKGNAAAGATSLQLHSVDGITIGAAVSGSSFIQAGTTVTAINTSTKTITISQATSGGQINQGSNINVDGLENITYLTKTGSGTWTLSGANTHNGFTKISAGTLTLANALALQNSPIDMVGSINGTATAGLKTTATALNLGGLSGTASPKNLSSIFTTTSGGYNGVTELKLNTRAAASHSYSGIIADGAAGMTLTKTGAGTQILGGNNSYTGQTLVSQGKLIINGAVASTSVVVNASLGGSGVMANATLSGSGSINPGNSPGIMTASATNPSGGLDYNFEFTAANTAPTYGNAAASVNDVLRLTNATPFTANLDSANIISLYLNVGSLTQGDVFTGGFYTDNNASFLTAIGSATFQYFLADAGGATTYEGNTYTAYAGPLAFGVSTVSQTANFGAGDVNGYVTQFTAVPEPRAALLGGLGLLALLRRRRD